MMRIKLFGLFIAFALLALVRPRKCLELLEAADAGASKDPSLMAIDLRRGPSGMVTVAIEVPNLGWVTVIEDNGDIIGHIVEPLGVRRRIDAVRAQLAQECTLPPTGWRCTRRAGHDGPCAAVAK